VEGVVPAKLEWMTIDEGMRSGWCFRQTAAAEAETGTARVHPEHTPSCYCHRQAALPKSKADISRARAAP
jgi:hypothetical protein